ncbi:MAG: peptidase [Prolixibacteraceae bacterium]|nr:peptidase [Prolixibacteraceae bacterium]
MTLWSKSSWRKWLRIIHRDLGYFTVGITLIYAISGIILNHKQSRVDPAFKTINVDAQLAPMLTVDDFTARFERDYADYTLNKILPEEQTYQLFLKGGLGYYNAMTGELSFEVYQKKPLVYFMNKLHYNQKNYWTTPADFYAGALIFFVLSGLFMVRGKNSLLQRGKWYVLAGILLVVLYIWL